MEKKINIAELLKDAPKGTEFYSPYWGTIKFSYFEGLENSFIVFHANCKGEEVNDITFNKYGYPTMNRIAITDDVCFFPSKDNRSWENFKAPWKHKHFETFQKVLVKSDIHAFPHDTTRWTAKFFSHMEGCQYVTIDEGVYKEEEILPYECNEGKLGKEVG